MKSFILKYKKLLIPLIISSIFAIVLLIIVIFNYIPNFIEKNKFENQVLKFANKNDKTTFSINEITLFSSCDVKNKLSGKSNFTIENLFAYTDIAIFINKNSSESTLENTLKDVTLKNFSIDQAPQDGQAKLYYKSLNQFAKSLLPNQLENSSENLQNIENELDFETISKETSDFSNPILYNNCANPITLSYLIENIKTDYTILDTSTPITYNGSLLKRCAVPISNIESKISFEIYITNYKDEKFKSKVFITIPFKNDTNSIYDGNITIKQNTNFVFINTNKTWH